MRGEPAMSDHERRVKAELRAAGMTTYGLSKLGSSFLPKIIHENEHIHGVVYGQSKQGSVMLVATDKRIIYLDKKPLYSDTDEMTYDVVAGVRITMTGFFTSVILHTRVGEYELRYVNRRCALHFVEYVERRTIEHAQSEH